MHTQTENQSQLEKVSVCDLLVLLWCNQHCGQYGAHCALTFIFPSSVYTSSFRDKQQHHLKRACGCATLQALKCFCCCLFSFFFLFFLWELDYRLPSQLLTSLRTQTAQNTVFSVNTSTLVVFELTKMVHSDLVIVDAGAKFMTWKFIYFFFSTGFHVEWSLALYWTYVLSCFHRAPVLVALALIESGMKYEDAVQFIRQ